MTKPKRNTDAANPNFDSRKYCQNPIPKKLGVFGSRSLFDERVLILIKEKMNEGFTHILTCQEPGGVSECAQKIAKQYGYPLQCHFLNMQYLRGAFEQRSKEIIIESDEFWLSMTGKAKELPTNWRWSRKAESRSPMKFWKKANIQKVLDLTFPRSGILK